MLNAAVSRAAGGEVDVEENGHALLVTIGLSPRRAVALAGDDVPACAPICVAKLSDLTERAVADLDWAVVVVVASSYAQLRRDAVVLDLAGRARRIVVHVADRRPSWWQLAAPVGVDALAVQVTQHGTRTEGSGRQLMSVRDVAAAAASARQPSALRPGSGLRLAVAGPLTWQWAVEEPSAHLLERAVSVWDDRASMTPAYDVLVERRPAEPDAITRRFDRPVLDTAVVNPAGFRPSPPDGAARLTVHHGAPALQWDQGLVRLGADVVLTTSAVRRLRRLPYVDLRTAHMTSDAAAIAPRLLARLLAVLAGLGVPVVSGPLPGAVRGLLHPDLVSELEVATTDTLTSPTGRESVSIRQRRAALRTHSSSAAWQQVRAELGLPRLEPTVSVVAASRRPDFLRHLLRTVGAQRNVRSETVVVTHGYDADRHALAGLLGHNVTLVRGPDGAPLGQLLALGSSMAAGDVVAKMDDDDWYGPHHLEDLTQAMAWSGAVLAGAPNDHIYLAEHDVTVTRPRPTSPDTAARYLAGPTLMIRRDDLRAVGGWRHQPASVDLALVRAVQESGGMVTRIRAWGSSSAGTPVRTPGAPGRQTSSTTQPPS